VFKKNPRTFDINEIGKMIEQHRIDLETKLRAKTKMDKEAYDLAKAERCSLDNLIKKYKCRLMPASEFPSHQHIL